MATPDSVAMMSWTFFREFLRNWKHTGAVAPSSAHLARCMVEAAQIAKCRSVLELGPGTGAITRHIAEALPDGARYVGLDMNGAFVKRLRARFPRLRFETAAAQEFNFSLLPENESRYEAIISGLPWTAFPEPLQVAILDHVMPRLTDDGVFVTFAYRGFHLLPAGRHFRDVLAGHCAWLGTSRTVWRNLPPAFVYIAHRDAERAVQAAS